MPMQVDEAGGEALRLQVERLGLGVRLGARTVAVDERPGGLRVRLEDGDRARRRPRGVRGRDPAA